MKPDRLDRYLQQNLLCLLCYDDQNAKIIRNTVPVDLFEASYRTIAETIYPYIDEYGKAPGDHVADLLVDIIEGSDKRRSKHFKNTLLNIFESYEGINASYVMDQVHDFIRQQYLKQGIVEAFEALQRGTRDDLLAAETSLNDALKKRHDIFEPGIFLGNTERSLNFLDAREPAFPTGIKEFDQIGIGPIRKGLQLFIGLPKRGKTWWMVNLGRRALLQRYKVLHVTLEMSEEKMAQRYYQCLFALAKYGGTFKQTKFDLDDLGRLVGLEREDVKPSLALDDPDIRPKLSKKINHWGIKFNKLLIKEFPTGQLTVRELTAYLDALQASQNFTPDLLLVDYADLMQVSIREYRHSLGNIYKELRGIAVERNLAVATASQSHRAGQGLKLISGANVAEDYSKIAIADSVITYNQTLAEKSLGLARLFLSEAREDADKFVVLISQNYHMGQFVRASTRMRLEQRYWDLLEESANLDDDGPAEQEVDEDEE